MGLLVLNFWRGFAEIPLIITFHFTMSYIVHLTQKLLCSFLKGKTLLSQQTFPIIKSLFAQRNIPMTYLGRFFVGVREDDCNKSKISVMVTKKNTQICRLSVLSAVWNRDWTPNNPIVTYRKYRCNFFAGSYV